ncbi:MAG: N-acetyltransferase family protein [Chloroflexota bacterium]|nr:N-acetyltransferase family protein [Chloroflexota bacterium]
MSTVRVERMRPGHWPAVQSIYQAGIATGNATLEREAPDWEGWDAGHRPDCRFVAVDGDRVLGWVALSPFSSRTVYTGVAWVSVYVAPDAQRRGIGRSLVEAVVEASEEAGIWTLMAGILPENGASLALHERAGFRRIGVQRRLGRDAGERWRDVVLMERRSAAG